MKEKIFNDVIAAMKARDKELLSVLRMLKGAIQLEEINKKIVLKDEEVISILSKQIKTRKESIKEFEKGDRPDLASKTQSEIDILEKYMPKQLSEEEIKFVLEKIFSEIKPESIKDMGKVMGKASALLKGKADLGLVSSMIKDMLTK